MKLSSIFVFLFCFVLLFACLVSSKLIIAETSQVQRIRKSMPHADNLIVSEPRLNRMTIVGAITASTLKTFKQSIDEYPQIQELVIDSSGGDINASVDIATIIKERKMNIVVDGRCFSSCALFLFLAAEKKTVLKNSLIGIHEMSFSFKDEEGNKTVTGSEIEAEILKHIKSDVLNDLHKSRIKVAKFYKLIGIQPIHYDTYVKYISSRKRYLGTEDIHSIEGNASCPRFLGWMLNQQQLESAGIKGIESFWFPKNAQETQALYQAQRILPNSFYQGDASTLLSYCQEKPISWVSRFWNSIKKG